MQRTRERWRWTTYLSAGLLALPFVASANPTGGVVNGGAASIATQGNVLTVTQTTPKAIIDKLGAGGFHGDPASLQVAQDQCVRFIEQSGVISAAVLAQQLPGWRLPDAPRQWALEVTQPVVARSAAFRFVEPFTGLECIEKQGTVIGDNDGEPVLTPYDDCVLVMPSTRQAQSGVTVVRYARRTLL